MKIISKVPLCCALILSGVSLAFFPPVVQAQTPLQEERGTGETERARAMERSRAVESERNQADEEKRRVHRERPGEWYAAAFGGVTIGHEFSDVERSGAGAGLSTNDIDLKNSGVYGGKVGYFLPDRWNWLGFEVEGFNTTPHLKQEGGIPGSHLRVTTAAFNVVARAQMACDPDRDDRSVGDRSRGTSSDWDDRRLCRFQPYIGAGPGVFFARTSNGTSSSDNGVVGLNALVGARYFFTKKVAMFAEYKYNRASFDFDAAAGGRIEGDYSASHVVGGLSLHW